MTKFDLVIFDCDGTLADSEAMNCLACSMVLRELGYERYTHDVVYSELVGVTLKDIGAIVAKEYDIPMVDDFAERIVNKVGELAPAHLKAVPNVDDAVKWANENYKICVASNGEPRNVRSSVHVLGLAPFFPDDLIFTQAMVERGKPEPDLFLLAAKTLGADPARCLVVEDTVVGVKAAKAAGMTAIGFIQMHAEDPKYADKLRGAGADMIMDDWSEFQSLASK